MKTEEIMKGGSKEQNKNIERIIRRVLTQLLPKSFTEITFKGQNNGVITGTQTGDNIIYNGEVINNYNCRGKECNTLERLLNALREIEIYKAMLTPDQIKSARLQINKVLIH